MTEPVAQNSLVLLNKKSNSKFTIDFGDGGEDVISRIMALFLKKEREQELKLNNKYTLEIQKDGKRYMEISSYDEDKLDKLFDLFKKV